MWMLQASGESDLTLEPRERDVGGESGEITFTTRRRRSATSSARNTRDMPPPPSSRLRVYACPSVVWRSSRRSDIESKQPSAQRFRQAVRQRTYSAR